MERDYFKTVNESEKAIKKLSIKRQLTQKEREYIAQKFKQLLEQFEGFF